MKVWYGAYSKNEFVSWSYATVANLFVILSLSFSHNTSFSMHVVQYIIQKANELYFPLQECCPVFQRQHTSKHLHKQVTGLSENELVIWSYSDGRHFFLMLVGILCNIEMSTNPKG